MRFSAPGTIEDATALIRELGMLPLFANEIPGFSLEESMAKEEGWFDKLWLWREQLAASESIAYGRLFRGRMGFICANWYARLANFRRDGYDFDSRRDEGLVPERERQIYALLESGPMRSGDLKRAYAGKGFDSAIARLQMQTYVLVEGFDYKINRFGDKYGMGSTVYAIAENALGKQLVTSAYGEEPAESLAALTGRLLELNPDISPERAEWFLK